MTNSRIHAAIALGSAMMVGAFVAFLPPVPPASAQSQAQRICREQGISPRCDGYEYCLSQATRALNGASRARAQFCPRHRRRARCLPGLRPAAADLGLPARASIARPTRVGLLVYADEQPKYGPQIADHP